MISDFTKKLVRLVPIILTGIAFFSAMLTHGQQPPQKPVSQKSVGYGENVTIPGERYEAPYQTQLKTLTTMEEAHTVGRTVVGKRLKIISFRRTGEQEMIIEAPDCSINA